MKKLALVALTLTAAASVFAQGTVSFTTRTTGTYQTHVYYNSAVTFQVRGMGAADLPVGTTDWAGYTAIAGSGYSAAILSIASGNPETAMAFATPTTTFRTGATAGAVALTTATLANVALDAASASLEVFAWDNKGGTILNPATAWDQWSKGAIAGGTSGAFTLSKIGGALNTTPTLYADGTLVSFNIYTIPEPTTVALAGLGAAAMLIFRRRK